MPKEDLGWCCTNTFGSDILQLGCHIGEGPKNKQGKSKREGRGVIGYNNQMSQRKIICLLLLAANKYN